MAIDSQPGPMVDQEIDPTRKDSLIEMLSEDNSRLRAAGCRLGISAMSVIMNYDGCHRLALAVADWCKAIADEGGRSPGKGERR